MMNQTVSAPDNAVRWNHGWNGSPSALEYYLDIVRGSRHLKWTRPYSVGILKARSVEFFMTPISQPVSTERLARISTVTCGSRSGPPTIASPNNHLLAYANTPRAYADIRLPTLPSRQIRSHTSHRTRTDHSHAITPSAHKTLTALRVAWERAACRRTHHDRYGAARTRTAALGNPSSRLAPTPKLMPYAPTAPRPTDCACVKRNGFSSQAW